VLEGVSRRPHGHQSVRVFGFESFSDLEGQSEVLRDCARDLDVHII
jgi:hypothetical protein